MAARDGFKCVLGTTEWQTRSISGHLKATFFIQDDFINAINRVLHMYVPMKMAFKIVVKRLMLDRSKIKCTL